MTSGTVTGSDSNVLARTRGHSSFSSSSSSSQQHATSHQDVLAAAAIQQLREKGITNPESFLEAATPEAILGACRWFDDQRGRIGTGVLVNELRAGGKPGYSEQKSMLDREREYGELICSWLRAHFPDLCDPLWGPHPVSIVAVIHLHHRYGKGGITAREHGPEIRAAVAAWNAKHGDPRAVAAPIVEEPEPVAVLAGVPNVEGED